MLISFIIPLYNCATYIERCLDSIYLSHKDESSFEVIVINDGSADDGLQRVVNYSKRHKNLIVRSYENAGASEARNRGLELAAGDFVWFVDADDSLTSEAFVTVVDSLKKNPTIDVLCFNHKTETSEGTKECLLFKEPRQINGLDYLSLHTSMYLWDKIYKRATIENIRFLKGIRNTEDWLFNVYVMLQASSVKIETFHGYIYNHTNVNSTLSCPSLSSLEKNSDDTLLVHKNLQRLISDQKEDVKVLLSSLLNFGVSGHLYALFVDALPNVYIEKIINSYKQMGLYPIVPSYSRKGNLFARLANNENLFLLFVTIKRILRSPKWTKS